MSALAVLLAAVGLADLLPRWKHVGGIAVAVAGPLALGLGWHTVWLVAVVTVLASGAPLEPRPSHPSLPWLYNLQDVEAIIGVGPTPEERLC